MRSHISLLAQKKTAQEAGFRASVHAQQCLVNATIEQGECNPYDDVLS
jgi:hypothetical protein